MSSDADHYLQLFPTDWTTPTGPLLYDEWSKKKKKGGLEKEKKKDLKRKKGSGTCQGDKPSKNISLLLDLPRYRSETGHEINKGQEKWRNSVYSC